MLRSLLLPPRDRYRREWWWLLWVGVALGVLLGAALVWERDTLVASERERLAQQASVIHDNLARQLQSIDKGLASILDAIAQTRALGADQNRAQERIQALADAMVAYDAGDWRVACNVVNLTDKVHITQCLARGDCFYGQARTYTLTSTYRF